MERKSFTISQDLWDAFKAFAEEHYDGNVSMALRYAIKAMMGAK